MARAQRVVGPLTGGSGDVGSVGVCSQLSRSLVSPAEHVGKHIEGVAGCRACAGSGGIAGGPTCGDKLGESCAQAVSSNPSSASIIARSIGLMCGFIGNLRLGVGAPLLFGAGGFNRLVALLLGLELGRVPLLLNPCSACRVAQVVNVADAAVNRQR